MRGATAPSNQNMVRNELRETGVSAYTKEFAESLPGSFKCFTLLFLHLQISVEIDGSKHPELMTDYSSSLRILCSLCS